MLKKIATITKDNDDTKRALEYFREVLEMYYREGKSNEVGTRNNERKRRGIRVALHDMI